MCMFRCQINWHGLIRRPGRVYRLKRAAAAVDRGTFKAEYSEPGCLLVLPNCSGVGVFYVWLTRCQLGAVAATPSLTDDASGASGRLAPRL